MKKFSPSLLVMALVVSVFFVSRGFCAEYSAEVMTVKGSASLVSGEGQKKALKEGDILKVGSVVEVDKDSHLDLAYDSQWNNITRISADSKVKIRSIYPTGLFMDKGDILAKLHKLPAQSTFEIETPTAIAAVRGSEYRTVHRDGVTDVFNLHTSDVEVYGKELNGAMMREPIVLEQNEKTAVDEIGEAPRSPEPASEKEKNENNAISQEVRKATEEHESAGEIGKTQEIEAVEKVYSEDLNREAAENAVFEKIETRVQGIVERIDQKVENIESNTASRKERRDDKSGDGSNKDGSGGPPGYVLT